MRFDLYRVRRALLICAYLFACPVYALEKDIEVDILTTRITGLLKEGKNIEALPLFEKLEGMNVKVPESFDFYYIDTLDKAGTAAKALERSETYLKKYGKKGKYYGQVIEIVGRRSAEVEKAADKAKAAEESRRAKLREEELLPGEIEAGMVRIPYSSPFLISKTEVTLKQWRALMGGDPPDIESASKNCNDCAVTHVSWNDAQKFIMKLNTKTQGGYRLPSVAEWKFACNAGTKNEYCGSDSVDSVAWHMANSGGKVHPVGQKNANTWGIFDMSGNVWEWTDVCSNRGCNFRLIIGGGWDSHASFGGEGRTLIDGVDSRTVSGGFRLARTSR